MDLFLSPWCDPHWFHCGWSHWCWSSEDCHWKAEQSCTCLPQNHRSLHAHNTCAYTHICTYIHTHTQILLISWRSLCLVKTQNELQIWSFLDNFISSQQQKIQQKHHRKDDNYTLKNKIWKIVERYKNFKYKVTTDAC